MHITLDNNEIHTIQAYDNERVQINKIIYSKNVLVNEKKIISPWMLNNITQLNEETLNPLLEDAPDLILIGHHQLNTLPSLSFLQNMAAKRIGLECMGIGAACRTFNVLLAEGRRVGLGLLFEKQQALP